MQYGYGVIGVVVMFESMGLPLPAETLIISSALYCAATHRLDIGWVAVAAIAGAIMGDNFGYLIGRSFGFRLLERHGAKVCLTPRRLLLGRYLFRRHGGKVVFFGRFIAILRVFAALLAGANRMPWHTFLFYNAMGGIGWAGGYAFGTYYLGHQVLNISGPVGLTLGAIALLVIGSGFVFLKRNEVRLTEEATKAAEREQHSSAHHRDRQHAGRHREGEQA
ncbi:DedA family protein [Nguyenibacter vanlangensis]|uniref:DedA family protein n=1 Tax=Nguyenibacter vanlangensis TaxID=1216886 RepID=A0A7Y7M6P3_9PROT|nr:DedA family protein [Nguyenibacter vanlangensis]NVN13210.1 DedA family protein [Nguyenibacter vanlangensis]